jgi:hypothetical protein
MRLTNLDEVVLDTISEINNRYRMDDEVRQKARMFDVLIGASKREVEALWDFMNATGAQPEPLIEILERKQAAAR